MLLTQKNLLLICLSLLVAFAPIPALVANATTNTDIPCDMKMDVTYKTGHVSEHHAYSKNTESQEHCNNCNQDNHSCQQCDCSVIGCAITKVQHYSGSTEFPRLATNHSDLVNYISHPPHSRLTPPLLRPPIQLHF